jgi:hypothetical protein
VARPGEGKRIAGNKKYSNLASHWLARVKGKKATIKYIRTWHYCQAFVNNNRQWAIPFPIVRCLERNATTYLIFEIDAAYNLV